MAELGLYSFKSKDMVDNNGNPLLTYYFPPQVQQDSRVLHMNQGGGAIQPLERMEGSAWTWGTSPAAPGYAELTATFDFIPPWLSNNRNSNTTSLNGQTGNTYLDAQGHGGNYALNLAIDDFYAKVVEGGVGWLVDQFATGVNPDGSFTVMQRANYASINGDVTVIYLAGGTVATLQCSLVIATGKWKYPDGSYRFVR